jgi:hypothetical protein
VCRGHRDDGRFGARSSRIQQVRDQRFSGSSGRAINHNSQRPACYHVNESAGWQLICSIDKPRKRPPDAQNNHSDHTIHVDHANHIDDANHIDANIHANHSDHTIHVDHANHIDDNIHANHSDHTIHVDHANHIDDNIHANHSDHTIHFDHTNHVDHIDDNIHVDQDYPAAIQWDGKFPKHFQQC